MLVYELSFEGLTETPYYLFRSVGLLVGRVPSARLTFRTVYRLDSNYQ